MQSEIIVMKHHIYKIQSILQKSLGFCNLLIVSAPPHFDRLKSHFAPLLTPMAVLLLGSAILVSCHQEEGCSEAYQQGLQEGYNQGYEDGSNQARLTYGRLHLEQAHEQGLITDEEYRTLLQEDSL